MEGKEQGAKRGDELGELVIRKVEHVPPVADPIGLEIDGLSPQIAAELGDKAGGEDREVAEMVVARRRGECYTVSRHIHRGARSAVRCR